MRLEARYGGHTAMVTVLWYLVACGSEMPGGLQTRDIASPDPPRLAPCPEGWTEVDAAAGEIDTVCEPWLPDQNPTCVGDDEAAFPGQPDCLVLGPACADWAEGSVGAPAGDRAALYVRGDTETAGEGTRDRPFGTLSEALGAARPGTTILLGPGRYVGAYELPDGVELRGACVAETLLVHPGGSIREAVITSRTGVGAVRNLQMTGPGPGIVIDETAVLEVENVLLQDVAGTAIRVAGDLTAHDLVVRGPPQPIDAETAFGALQVVGSGRAEVARAVFEDNPSLAIFNESGGELTLEQVVVRNPRTLPGMEMKGSGILSEGQLELRESTVECADGAGVAIEGERAVATLSDLVVRGATTRGSCDSDATAMGLWFGRGATARLERALLERNAVAAVAVVGADIQLTISDTVIRATSDAGNGVEEGFGAGLAVQGFAQVHLQRVLLSDNSGVSMLASWDSSIDGTDVVIEETRGLPCEAESPCINRYGLGSGLLVRGGEVTLTRFDIRQHAVVGVQLVAGGADLELGRVSHNPIGVNVQFDGYDLARLQDRVAYVDNERNLDAVVLPVPDLEAVGSPW